MFDTFVGSRLVLSYDWILEPVEKTTTVLTQLILFRGEKVFRICLKDSTKTKNPKLIFLVANLNKSGLKVKEVRYSKQGFESIVMKERQIKKTMDGGENNFQLFTVDLTELPFEKCTFCFSICIVGSVSDYSYHLSDRLTKEQFWNASLKSQHRVDVEFVVKDKKFSAHKAVLAARSPVFAARFTKKEKPIRNAKYSLQQIIRIDDVHPASVEQFLYFLYTGETIKSSLVNEELLKLAERFQVITLINLCRAALKNIDIQQMMNCMCSLNPGASAMRTEAKFSDSIRISPDKETEIFHDSTTSVFHCNWQTNTSACLIPNNIIEYQNEKLFAPHLTGNVLFHKNGIEHPGIHLICTNHRNFGFKAVKVFYFTADCETWLEMKPRRADNVELFLFVAQSIGSLKENPYLSHKIILNFRIKMTSTIENYHYEMMDTLWTTQLWQAALDQQLTDVEILVGPIKLEAHRVILSARSPVLSVLLDNNDHVKSSIVIEEKMDIGVVKHFLKFLYTGCLEMSAMNKQLLELAELYEVKTLMKICQVAKCISPNVTSKLDASKIDVSDEPSVTVEMDLEVVKHFLAFVRTGSLDSRINTIQLTTLAKMYEVETLKKICQLNRSVPLDMDEVTTFLLTAL